jgi:nitroreductase
VQASLAKNTGNESYLCGMSANQFDQLHHIIKSRRSVSWAKMNGSIVPDNDIVDILALADWAPTHARTEPWRFFVYAGEAKAAFGALHAGVYWDHTAEENRQESVRQKLTTNVDLASHVVLAVMKRGQNDKIPVLEEIAAASCAIQNVLLGATAKGIASFWSTGGMVLKKSMKEAMQLADDDHVLGLLYFGYTDEAPREGTRNTPLSEKIVWM